MYLSYEEYLMINPKNIIDEFDYNAYELEAEMYIDKFTMTIDGVRKLQIAFPADEHSKRAVHTCMAALISKISTIEKVKEQMLNNSLNGEGGIISSKSSGSESIAYSTSVVSQELQFATDEKKKEEALYNLIRKYLYGIQDANGVNLFYGGCYPCIKTQ